jgi:hypothetical protein
MHLEEKYDKNCVVPTFKQSMVCVMVWRCIIKGKKEPLVVLEYLGEERRRTECPKIYFAGF